MDSTAVEAKIPIALLLTCRQIYLEALPTLHQRNTFCFPADDFAALFSALGRHCLPHIRYLNIYAPYKYRHGYSLDRTWRTVFPNVRKMRLMNLALGFKNAHTATGPFRDIDAIMDTLWAHSVLGIRGLRRFRLSLKFVDGVPPTLGLEIEGKFQQLMIGPGADERYDAFMNQYGGPLP
ncbi:hypothetical protein K438DRAFT_1997615 [Mycena galopus ATCC 62051]|nr:hypothetical protein K438DRAFT_1997615 [Mycena galopus ATCC 62051]